MFDGPKVKLPPEVAAIYKAVESLENKYPDRRFTPDGHLVGSIGEIVAAEALGLKLYPMSQRGHDAYDSDGDVQIKLTGARGISMYGESDRLIVLQIVDPTHAQIVYDGPGAPAWNAAGPMRKNGQRWLSLAKLKSLKHNKLPPA